MLSGAQADQLRIKIYELLCEIQVGVFDLAERDVLYSDDFERWSTDSDSVAINQHLEEKYRTEAEELKRSIAEPPEE